METVVILRHKVLEGTIWQLRQFSRRIKRMASSPPSIRTELSFILLLSTGASSAPCYMAGNDPVLRVSSQESRLRRTKGSSRKPPRQYHRMPYDSHGCYMKVGRYDATVDSIRVMPHTFNMSGLFCCFVCVCVCARLCTRGVYSLWRIGVLHWELSERAQDTLCFRITDTLEFESRPNLYLNRLSQQTAQVRPRNGAEKNMGQTGILGVLDCSLP